ncbi:hypothetical protein [Neolewinella antarctica]|uniref:Uncharacterized protein n=1 Tax=Neolewinella antarctica TaxID=442734 RepID=A0ABX0XFF9_9BACT|nr:hypothetical protein [Neolewinella antarctica]NJC28050.1 hypothetical protein [Neolewinella antarctica]
MKLSPASFKWIGAGQEEFAVFPEHYRAGEAGRVSLRLAFGYDLSKRIVFTKVTADFFNNDNLFLRCALTCRFEIGEDSWKDRESPDGSYIDIEQDLHVHFGAFTFGTLRGYLFARQQQSVVSAFLPPVNVIQMVSEMEETKPEVPA